MNVSSVRAGDIVECDVKGRRFFALVAERVDPTGAGLALTRLKIRPITAGITHRNVTSRQVVGHYRRSKTSARAREEAP